MKKFVLLLIALAAMGLSNVWAYDFDAIAPSGHRLCYTISGGNAEVTGQNSHLTGALVIPASVAYDSTTYSVTSIGDYAFSDCSGLTSVTIPNSVTSIGEYAFWGCYGLTSVTIPNSVTSIGDWAFQYCYGLTSVTIPNSVTSIGSYAFRACNGLTSIIVESGNTYYDSRNNCNAIIETNTNKLIAGCNNTIIPNSVTSIGVYAFYCCNGLTSVTIPNSVTSIGDWAFAGCSGLTEMTVLATVPPSLGDGAFYGMGHNIPVYIPCGRTQYYLARDGWNEFNNYQEISGAVLTVESNNELWGTAEIQQAHTCTSPTAIIRANAQSGYHFVRWNDNNTDNPRTVTVTEDATYTAYFAADQSNGINEISGNVAISVCGNSIFVSNAQERPLRIFDIQGRMIVSEKAVGGKQYTMPHSGVYMVQIGNYPAQKVVVVR